MVCVSVALDKPKKTQSNVSRSGLERSDPQQEHKKERIAPKEEEEHSRSTNEMMGSKDRVELSSILQLVDPHRPYTAIPDSPANNTILHQLPGVLPLYIHPISPI